MAGNIDERLTVRANRTDGKEVWMSSAAEVIMGAEGKPERVIGVFQNITSSKQAERALVEARDAAEAANRSKSEFLANMSHEIRTPLNGVLGMTQVIEGDELTDVQRERVRVVRESGTALLAILNDLLDLSKIQAGKLELTPTDFDMTELAPVVAAAFEGTAASKDISLELIVEETAKGVWVGDVLRLRQVLSNLVSNGLKFTGQGRVTLAVQHDGTEMRFAVKDTGIGIDADKIPYLFEKFAQEDASTTRRYGGTGLGLSICRELVDLMGGRIEATSEKGVGSTFTVILPLKRGKKSAAAARAMESGVASPIGSRALRILAAEDNATNQLVLRSLLAPLGVDLTVAGDGRAAVEAYANAAFDIVLMDVQMPEMNGVEATVAIRALEAERGGRRTPILALSANVMTHQISEYADAGMDGCIAKPIEVEKLYRALDEALSLAQPAALSAANAA
jgi:signal transduction histidine kinase/ActR/RegA family two-component response regulator